MRRFRQWLAETANHMTVSPDGGWAIYTEALAAIEAGVKEITESRDEWKRQWRLMEAAEKKAEEQIATLMEEGQEDARINNHNAEVSSQQIVTLQGETSRLYAVTVEQSRQIAALTDALSGRDGIIERLKGYLVNKKTDIAEKVEYIAALTEDRDKWQSKAHYQNQDNLRLTAELKSLTEAYNNTDWKKKNDALTEAIKLAYRKHHLNDDSIGWEELSDVLLNALCETMGDKGYQDWMDALKQGKEAGDE